VWVLKDKHWLTQPPYWEKFVASYITAVACAWIGYVKYHWYGVFVICFTLQVAKCTIYVLVGFITIVHTRFRSVTQWIVFAEMWLENVAHRRYGMMDVPGQTHT